VTGNCAAESPHRLLLIPPGVGDVELRLGEIDRAGAITLNDNAMLSKLAGGQVAAETDDDFTTEKSSGTETTGS